MSKAKRKGTAAETAVVRYLEANGFPTAERRSLAGAADKGDVTGIPGIVIEIKAAKKYEIPGWLKEAAQEGINAKAEYAILIMKPNGKGEGSVNKWWAIVDVEQMTNLLRDAGYGQPRNSE